MARPNSSLTARVAKNKLSVAKTKAEYKDSAQKALQAQAQSEIEQHNLQEELNYEREKHSPYQNWAQINLDPDYLYRLMKLGTKQAGALAVELWWLLVQACDRTNAVVISQRTMCEITGASLRNIQYAIQTLKDESLVEVVRTGSSSIYLLNDGVIWKGYGALKGACEFKGNIVLSKEEQAGIKKIKKAKKSVHKTVSYKDEKKDE